VIVKNAGKTVTNSARGKLIRSYMKGISDSELARITQLTRRTISKAKSGEDISFEKMMAIVQALGIEPAFLHSAINPRDLKALSFWQQLSDQEKDIYIALLNMHAANKNHRN
tara:strand:+ start:13976 stop:14311 length:336 start_codon:yes stop_codon:yes gene_type:complete